MHHLGQIVSDLQQNGIESFVSDYFITEHKFSCMALRINCHVLLIKGNEMKIDSIKLGGISAILASFLFTGIFIWLMINFNYPDILDGEAKTVLPNLIAMGSSGRVVWAFYAFLPLLWIPVAVGTYNALREINDGFMQIAKYLLIICSISMMLGLMRWPSIQWHLGLMWEHADSSQQEVLSSVFGGINTFFGNYIGEFLGELCLSTFIIISGYTMLKSNIFKKWRSYFNIITGVVFLAGAFRNIPGIIGETGGFVSEVTNMTMWWSIWLIIFGFGLIKMKPAAN